MFSGSGNDVTVRENKHHLQTELQRVDFTLLHGVRCATMALAGIKPPGPLSFEGELAPNWRRWFRAYEYYAIATGAIGKAERVQCSLFLHVAGMEAQTLNAQFQYESDEQDRIQPLISKFKNYCVGKSNITVVRYKFNSHNQSAETMDAYIRELKAQVVDCEYGPLEDSLLRDRLVGGVASNKLREKLLQTEDLTLIKCIKMCRLSEVHATQVGQGSNAELRELDAINRDVRGRATQQWRTPPERNAGGPKTVCGWCGFTHYNNSCPAKGKECNVCHKIGHFARVCRSRGSVGSQPRPVHTIGLDGMHEPVAYSYRSGMSDPPAEDYNDDMFVGEIGASKKGTGLWYAEYIIGNTKVNFKLDTGAEVNIIPKYVYEQLINAPLRPVKCRIVAYSGHRIVPEGETTIKIQGQDINALVVSEGGPILGKEACEQLDLVYRVSAVAGNHNANPPDDSTKEAREMVKEFENVFEGLGLIKSNAHIHIDMSVTPTIDPPRRIPHAIEQNVRDELDRMLKVGVIKEQTEPTEWVNSITIVRKANKIRICLDPTRLNKAIKRGAVPVRTVEEVSAKLYGAKYFSVFDASSGYWQIELDEDSSRLCTFNTPWGRYRYTRLPFGIKTAGDIFISEMNMLLGDLVGVQVVTDDILVYGRDRKEHNKNMRELLKRAQQINLKLNSKKTKLCMESVEYVGHVISSDGIRPNAQRIQAIKEMPEPHDKAAVQRFLGMVNYVHKFIPNLSSIAEPLRITLKKNIAWHWGYEQRVAFNILKQALTNHPVLEHYNPRDKVTIQVDASKSGLGAALLQNDKPIALASKALNEAQSKYAVIEKELLAICFGVKRFHNYVYGQEIIIQTDHKPLVSIMLKPLHKLSARMQRMRMRLQNYNMTVQYINGKLMYFADTLSRAHTTQLNEEDLYDTDISIASLAKIAIDIAQIQKESEIDEVLQELKTVVVNGWPNNKKHIADKIQPYNTYKDEITVREGLLWKGERIIIPRKLHRHMVNLVHETHLGITKSLQLARDFMFWPGMTSSITDLISRCQICQGTRNRPHTEFLISHDIPGTPFEKIATDLFEFEGQHYIIIVDYYSKFIEVIQINALTSKHIISTLQETFCRFGIPAVVVSDNGPQFASKEYREFANEYGFTPKYTSPQHPQSNGQAERAIQTVKNMMKKAKGDKQNINLALLNYRNTPIAEINASPAQLLLSRRLRSKIPTTKDRLKPRVQPDMSMKIKMKQSKQKEQHDKHINRDHRIIRDSTNVRYLNHQNIWKKGIIQRAHDDRTRSYIIKNDSEKEIRRNRCQIFPCNNNTRTGNKTYSAKTEQTTQNDKTEIQQRTETQKTSRYGRQLKPVNKLNL